ncbi:MAG: PKD domain-containing protein [Saprospiraceae bacterium]
MRRSFYLILFFNLFYFISAAQVHAEFSTDQRVGCGALQVKFQNLSTGPIRSYQWDFGTGPISTTVNPSKVFVTPGLYKICLTVTDTAGNKDINCKLDFIKVNANFAANFKTVESVICSGTEGKFEDLTKSPNGKIVSWIWDLNGSAGVVQQSEFAQVASVYENPGQYAVTLSVKDEAGCSANVTKSSITVIPKPTVDISIPDNSICDSIGQINFINTSINSSEISYEWEFGNGQKYSGFTPPPITYQGKGTYDLSVTAIHAPTGCKTTKVFPSAVIVRDLATFSQQQQSSACVNEEVLGNPFTVFNVDSHLWDFGDGFTSIGHIPSHAYKNAGHYNITHTIMAKGCISTRTLKDGITIHGLPQVGYKLNDTTGCMFPLKIITSNQTEDAKSFSWTANGTEISTEQQPILEFGTEGNYKIGLLAINEFGCSAFIENKTVRAYKIKPVLLTGSFRGCSPILSYPLELSSSSADPITKITWTVFTATPKVFNTAFATIALSDTGSFSIGLKVQNSLGCMDSAIYDNWIQLGNKPVTKMILPKNICYGVNLEAKDSSSPFTNGYLWGIGNSATQSGSKIFQFSYSQLGPLTISHVASHYGCNGNTVTENVDIIGAKAEFSTKVEDCAFPLKRVFLNTSSGQDSVHWDFGVLDSTSDQSDLNQPSYTYPKKGNYTVNFTAINKSLGCAQSITGTVDLKVIKADFKLDHKTGCAPQDLAVTNLSEDASNYSFEFPGSDKINSTEVNPSFHFSTGINSKGTLIATDVDGCMDTVTVDSIAIYQSNAGIMAARTIRCQDSSLTLLNASKLVNDSIIRITWAYKLRTVQNKDTIKIKLDTINSSRISLHIESIKGCISDAILDLSINKIKATIQTDTLVCIKDKAIFTPDILGRWNNIIWNFGDGTSSSDTIGSHFYKSNGNYKVNAVISDIESGCIDTIYFPKAVLVGDPQALFSVISASTTCRPLIAKFKNNSKLVDKFEWDLGDQTSINRETNPTHLYSQQGYFNVRLIAKSSELCRDTLIIDSAIRVNGPSIAFATDTNHQICSPVIINFNTTFENTTSALLEWGDGGQDTLSEKSGKQLFTHSYKEPGLYYPVLVAIDSNACTEYAILDSILVDNATSRLRATDSLICAFEGDFSFKDSSYSSSLVQKIRFNIKSTGIDTTFDHIPEPFHAVQTGKYSVNYYFANEFCSDSAHYENLFSLSAKPSALFTGDQPEYCAGDTILLINESKSLEQPIISFYWQDDDIIKTGDSLIRILDQGLKTISLVVKTADACADTSRLDLDVKPSIFSTVSRDTSICAGSLVTLKSTILNPVEGMSYKWLAADSMLCSNCTDYTFRPEQSTQYHFITIHPNGCTRSFNQSIQTRINPIKNIQITDDTTVCKDEPIAILVNAINDVFAYTWDSTRSGLSCYKFCKNPIAIPTSNTTYVVAIRDGTGCERFDSVSINLKAPVPIDLGPDRTICRNDSLLLIVKDITQARWSGSSGISCTNCSSPVLRPTGPSMYILNALSQGCLVHDSIRINILTSDLIKGASDTTICIGSTVKLTGLSSKIINWSPDIFLDNATAISPVASPTSSITYRATAREDLCTTTDSIKINVLNNTVIKGVSRTVCPLDIVTLSVSGEADKYQWTGPDILSGQNSSSIQIKANNSAQYIVIARNKTCPADTEDIKVIVVDFIRLKDSVSYNVTSDQPFKLNKSLNANKKFIFNWSPASNLSCANCQDPVFVGNENKLYTFSIFDQGTSCMLEQKVTINIIPSCNVNDYFALPNIFTPNQDGKNDILFPIPKSTDQIKSFRIFDRTGEIVFESFDINFGWDGKLKGKEMANGVYVYLLEAECTQTGQSVFLSGDVTLIR